MRDEEADLEGLLLKGESGGGGLALERKRGARAWTGLVDATCCTSLHVGVTRRYRAPRALPHSFTCLSALERR